MDSVLFSMVLIINLIVRPVVPGIHRSKPVVKQELCQTRQCHAFSKMLKTTMKREVRPCYDFYNYVCGNFGKNNATEDYNSWLYYDGIKRSIQKKVIDYLLKPSKRVKNDPLKWAKFQFKACMNTGELDRLGVKPLFLKMEASGGTGFYRRVIHRSFKKWHEVHDYYRRLTGNGGLFTIAVRYVPLLEEYAITVDVVDNYFIHTSAESLQSSDIKRYKEFLMDIATEIYDYCCDNFLTKGKILDISKVIHFRSSLTTIKNTVEGIAQNFTIEKLQAETEKILHRNSINWLHLLRSMFNEISTVEIVDTTPIYLKNLPLFLATLEIIKQTPDQVISNHLHFYFLERYIMYSNMKMYELYQGMHPKALSSRSTACVSDRILTRAFNYIYVKYFLPKGTVPVGQTIVSDVEQMLVAQIHQTRWMSKSAKKVAEENVHVALSRLDYDNWDKDAPNLLLYYSELPITEDYLENALNFDSSVYTEDLSLLTKDWRKNMPKSRSRVSSNSEYPIGDKYAGDNVALPMLLHQLPFFGVDLPEAINYAGLGTIYGDILADVNGDWQHSQYTTNHWDAHSVKGYSDRLDCYAEKIANVLSKEFAPTVEINVLHPVAQYKSLVAALEAYWKAQLARRDGWRKIIHFEDIDGDKLFFIAYAMSRCAASNTGMFPLITDASGKCVDLPDSVNVNAALSNLQAFSDTFDCKPTDPMNSSPKCVFFHEQ